MLDGIKGLSPPALAKAEGGAVAANVVDDVGVNVGEEMSEVAGRKLVGVLDVKIPGADEVPRARAEPAAEPVQTAFAVTVTVTVPSAPVDVEGDPADGGAETAGAAAKGDRMLWPDGVDDTAVDVFDAALVGVGSGVDEANATELTS